ncbi:MAG: hypothetical protein JO280_13120 [Mycobacteriaceae bacterium]|nr:hypothetical protein [Mycobacteriaceae bacterium]
MRIKAIAVAGLVASTLVTTSAAQAQVTTQATQSHSYPLQPAPSPQPDPTSEAQDLRQQIAELNSEWDSLTADQRNQRIAQLQQQVTMVDENSRNLPQDQKAQVDLVLLPSLIDLGDLLRKAQSPNQPCFFPLCLPGL